MTYIKCHTVKSNQAGKKCDRRVEQCNHCKKDDEIRNDCKNNRNSLCGTRRYTFKKSRPLASIAFLIYFTPNASFYWQKKKRKHFFNSVFRWNGFMIPAITRSVSNTQLFASMLPFDYPNALKFALN